MIILQYVALALCFLALCVLVRWGRNPLKDSFTAFGINIAHLYQFLKSKADKSFAYLVKTCTRSKKDFDAGKLLGSSLTLFLALIIVVAEFGLLRVTLAGILPDENAFIDLPLIGKNSPATLLAFGILASSLVLGIILLDGLGLTNFLNNKNVVKIKHHKKIVVVLPSLLLVILTLSGALIAIYRTIVLTDRSETNLLDYLPAIAIASVAVVIPITIAMAGKALNPFFNQLKFILIALGIVLVYLWKIILTGIQALVTALIALIHLIIELLGSIGEAILRIINKNELEKFSPTEQTQISKIIMAFSQPININVTNNYTKSPSTDEAPRSETLNKNEKRSSLIFVSGCIVFALLLWGLSKPIV